VRILISLPQRYPALKPTHTERRLCDVDSLSKRDLEERRALRKDSWSVWGGLVALG
jgi:hypothetical protein